MTRTPFLAFVVLAAGCAGSLESTVRDAHDAHRYPEGLTIVYDDRTPLLGGDRVEIDPDGAVRRWQDPPTAIDAGESPEDTFDDTRQLPPTPTRAPDATGTASAEALGRLLGLIQAIAPWSRHPADPLDDGRLERRRALLRVSANGNVASTWQWADPTETGSSRVTSIRRWAELEIVRAPRVVPTEPPEAEAVDAGPNPLLQNR